MLLTLEVELVHQHRKMAKVVLVEAGEHMVDQFLLALLILEVVEARGVTVDLV
jgi:hypothetical protein